MIEQARWADAQGFTTISLSEHHVTDDGYMPSPLVVGGAVAGATKRIPITVATVVAPLWDPIRLAEDLATLDNLAGPYRLVVTFAIGYRELEFEVLHSDFHRRGKRLEEVVAVLRQAWTGEPFEYEGRTVRVQPSPVTPGGPMQVMGGSSTIAARRAARLGMGMIPSYFDPAIEAAYHEECAAQRQRSRVHLPAERPELPPRQQRPRARLGPHRPARRARCRRVLLVADRGHTVDDREQGRLGRGDAAGGRVPDPHAGGDDRDGPGDARGRAGPDPAPVDGRDRPGAGRGRASNCSSTRCCHTSEQGSTNEGVRQPAHRPPRSDRHPVHRRRDRCCVAAGGAGGLRRRAS